MSERMIVTRDVSPAECPWLDRTFKQGETVFPYFGCTYGCVSPSGVAVTEVDGETPFFEFPRDALGDKAASHD